MSKHLFAVALLISTASITVYNKTDSVPNDDTRNIAAVESDDIVIEPMLLGVNTNVVLDFESLDTCVHWPGGNSGPTIGRGIDLGHATVLLLHNLFHGVVPDTTYREMLSGIGVTGQRSQSWIEQHKNLALSQQAANIAFHRSCLIFWKELELRFGHGINTFDPTIKGVLLSLAMNYGTYNVALDVLDDPIQARDARALSSAVHTLADSGHPALSKRRHLEGSLILLTQTAQHTNTKRESTYFD